MSKATEKAIDRAIRGLDRDGQTVPDDEHVLDPNTARVIRDLAANSGAADKARPYLIRRMRYHIGRAALPVCPTELNPYGPWLRRRAWDLVDEARRRLPPVLDETEPRS